MSDYLTIADLKKLYLVTFEARIKWRNILLILDVSPATINNISTKWQDSPDNCYREGLLEWLKGDERSWEDVVKALSSPIVGHSDIARTIERDHIQSTTLDVKSDVDKNSQKINKDLTIFLDERLGKGAFGVVFKGSYRGEICAVKLLIYEAIEMQTGFQTGKSEEASKSFDRECELLESLQHPNIVQYLSTAKHPKSDSTILVVELMDCNLRSYFSSLDEKSLTSQCEISLSKDIVCGLAYIHSKKIIHRDLCGDNILLKLTRPVPVAKISDFGMSRLYDWSKFSHTLTAIGHRMGYLPLEAIRLDNENYDSSLDVFSLGVIMVQIVCKLETIKSVTDRSFHVSQIPHTHRLRKVIDSCLQKDMTRRPSARDIYTSLESNLDATKRDAQRVNFDQNHQMINDDLTVFLDQRLGKGAFGVVFKGSYRGEICAVKVLLHDAMEMQASIPIGKDEEASDAIDRESDFLKSFQHPNVVQFLSAAKHPKSGGTILVLELMDCSLRSYFSNLDEESLTSECEISLSKDIACGLSYIHSKQIIHRDLCGDNILLKLALPVPVAKISDFGTSRLYDPSMLSHTLTAVGHRLGYLPLEAIRLDNEKYDNSLDVFSLGVIIVQIVCKLETIKSATDRSFHVAQIPHTHRLRKLIASCLQKDMRRRPSARDIYAALVSLTTGVQNQKFLQKLDELMSDKKNTIELQYFKMHFIGPSGIGKTTTRQRLVGSITNLSSLPKDQRKPCSTFLAECTQVLAFVSKSGAKIAFKTAENLEEETQLIFSYLISCEHSNIQPKEPQTSLSLKETIEQEQPLRKSDVATAAKTKTKTVSPTTRPEKSHKKYVATINVQNVITRLYDIVSLGDYSNVLKDTVLLNLVDIGGQPGFVEMFPFLSKGAGIFLAFFRLDKDLDEMCEVSYERGKDKITPYDSTYTSRETLSQILSAISHHAKIDSDIDRKQCDKLGSLGSAKPLATLIGTFKDELAMQIKVDLLFEKCCILKKAADKTDSTTASESDSTTASKSDSTTASESDSTTASESDSTTASKSDSTTASKSDSTTASESDSTTAEQKKAIRLFLPQDSSKKSDKKPNVTEQDMAAIQQTVRQHLNSDAFKKDVEDRLERQLTEKSKAVSTITSKFGKLSFNPKEKKFIAVDNYEGTSSDIDPLLEHVNGMINRYIRDSKLRIRPQMLLLGVVLRKEGDIISMEDCIRIGTEGLNMDVEEIQFTIWYLDRFVGALIYRPDIKGKDGYFGDFVICNPQVVFNSLSALVVKPLLELHSEESSIQFTEDERKSWILRGQFTLEMITHCNLFFQDVKKDQLIPVENLLILLEHSHLLAKITTHTARDEETTYFVPAILKCASREELTKPPPTGIDTPSPIKITFDPQYVPIGVFCAMISELVSRGSKCEGILGLTWELVDSMVKRNLVSFHVHKAAKHLVTLIAHVDCYEIRIIRQDRYHTMHELCSYVLSTILLVMKEISPLFAPIIAFDCSCGKFCLLTSEADPCFACACSKKISLSPQQERWFAKEVSVGDDVFLLALPFASDLEDLEPSLSFKWKKRIPKISGIKNELEFKASSSDHFKGLISCKISMNQVCKNQKSFFTVYHCLKESVENSVTDQLFADVKEVIQEIRSDWYSLAIELDIDYETRKSIEKDYRMVEDCFEAMLNHWVGRSPPPSWSAVIRALESPAIARGDIATKIKKKGKAASSPDICRLTPEEPLSVDCYLKVVRSAIWEIRATWGRLGLHLGIKEGTLDAIKRDYRNESGDCFTKLLEQWLTRSTPAPTLQALINVLESKAIDRGDIANEVPHTHKLRKLIGSCLQEDMTIKRPSAAAGDIYASLTRGSDTVEATKRELKDIQPVNYNPEPELELIKVSNCQPFHLPGADLSASATVTISNMECNLKLDGHGFQLSAKQNTLPSGLDKCTLEISPSTSGDYQFPDTLKPVSAIYWIRCKPRGITFQQPILAQIQHCAKPGSSKHLYFCRATCYEKKPPYVFRKVDARVSFSDDDFCGTIELEHFCGVCIGGEESVDQLYTAILFDYYSSPSHYIHMVITKNEETHKTEVDTVYGKKQAKKGCYVVFDFKDIGDTVDLALPLEGVCESDWKIKPLMTQKVKKKQIDNFSPGREIPCIQMKAETEQHKSTNVCYPLYLNKSVNPDLYLSVDVNIAKVIKSPSIRRDLPLVRKVRVHQCVSLTVHAQGTGLTYQWTKYGTPLRDEDDGYQGVSTSSLTMRQASLEQSGEYQCVVENEGGSVTSSTCKVTVGNTDGVPHTTIESATAAQLSQECSDEALLQLSTEIAGYNDYKYWLGLSSAEIGAIDQNPTFSSVSGKFYAALKKWKSKSVDFENPSHSTATYCRLVDIAKQLKDGTAIRNIHTACVKHCSRQCSPAPSITPSTTTKP